MVSAHMAYDDKLAARVRLALSGEPCAEKKMMGGLCFMVRGHMCVGVVQDKRMVRSGPEGHAKALTLKHVMPMDFTGKPLKGFVFALPPGCSTQRAVDAWVKRALTFTATLPAKGKLARKAFPPSEFHRSPFRSDRPAPATAAPRCDRW